MKEEFKQLIGGIQIVDEDAEGFDDAGMYQDFTERMTVLASDEIDIEVVGADEGVISLSINGEDIQVNYNQEDGWFDVEYVGQINQHLKSNDLSNKRFCFVEPYGTNDADQGVKIAFIDESIYQQLLDNSFANDEQSHLNHF